MAITGANGYVPNAGCTLYIDGESQGPMQLDSTEGAVCFYSAMINFGPGDVGVQNCYISYLDPIAMVVAQVSPTVQLQIEQPVP